MGQGLVKRNCMCCTEDLYASWTKAIDSVTHLGHGIYNNQHKVRVKLGMEEKETKVHRQCCSKEGRGALNQMEGRLCNSI